MKMIHLAHIEMYVLPVSSDCEDSMFSQFLVAKSSLEIPSSFPNPTASN